MRYSATGSSRRHTGHQIRQMPRSRLLQVEIDVSETRNDLVLLRLRRRLRSRRLTAPRRRLHDAMSVFGIMPIDAGHPLGIRTPPRRLAVREADAARLPGLVLLDVLEAPAGLEVGRLPRVVDALVELVDLLERDLGRLVDHHPHEDDGDDAAGAPDEEDLRSQIGIALARADHVGRAVCDGPVEEPVGCGGDGHRFRTDLQGVDLGRDDPDDGAPGHGEDGDVDADEGDEDLVPGLGMLVVAERRANGGNDELRDGHAYCAGQEETASAPGLDKDHAGKGHDDVDNVCHEVEHKRGRDASVNEERGAVVEDKVTTAELLQHLKTAASEDPASQMRRTSEYVSIGSRSKRQLVGVVRFDLCNLLDQGRVRDVETSDAGQRFGGCGVPITLDQISRRLREDDQAKKQDSGPEKLHGHGYPEASRRVDCRREVIDDRGDKKTNRDGQLVRTNQGTTDPFGCHLGLVQGDEHRYRADSHAGNEPGGC